MSILHTSKSHVTISTLPEYSQAQCKALAPLKSYACMLAPLFFNSLAISSCPFSAAQMKGVFCHFPFAANPCHTRLSSEAYLRSPLANHLNILLSSQPSQNLDFPSPKAQPPCVGITDFDLTQSSPTCSRVPNYLLTYARDVNQTVQKRTT